MTTEMQNRNPTYMGDYVTTLCKKSILFAQPIDVLVHMFTVLGNGVDYKNFNPTIGEPVYNNMTGMKYQYYSFDGDLYDTLEVTTPMYMYPYSKDSQFRPFTDYRKCDDDSRRGIKKALEYFIKCVETATLESSFDAICRSDTVMGVDRWYRDSNEELHKKAEELWADIQVWQHNIQDLKDELNHL